MTDALRPPSPSHRGKYVLLLLLIAALGTADCGGSGSVELEQGGVVRTVLPGQGVTVGQVDFDYPGGRDQYSTWGRLVLDPTALGKAGLVGGYVSVVTEKGWAIVNLPVPAQGEPQQSMYFDLGLSQSTQIGEISIDVKHSTLPLRDVRTYAAERIQFAVAPFAVDAYGIGSDADLQEIVPPDDAPLTRPLSSLPLVSGATMGRYQSVTNVECARSQCFPMAVANALQYMEDRGAFLVPHEHVMGLGRVGHASGDTLVGQLDIFSERVFVNRRDGEGLWFEPMIDGLFGYLESKELDGILTFRHQDVGYEETIPIGDYAAYGSTSLDDGAPATWNWIHDRVLDGCAITMVWVQHAVRITGSGQTLGLPWIRYSHDARQSTDTGGLESVVAYLEDIDGNGRLNLDGSYRREIRWVWAACP